MRVWVKPCGLGAQSGGRRSKKRKKLPEETLSQGGRGLRTCSGSDWTVAQRSIHAAWRPSFDFQPSRWLTKRPSASMPTDIAPRSAETWRARSPCRLIHVADITSIPTSCSKSRKAELSANFFATTHSCRRGGRIWHSREMVKCDFSALLESGICLSDLPGRSMATVSARRVFRPLRCRRGSLANLSGADSQDAGQGKRYHGGEEAG